MKRLFAAFALLAAAFAGATPAVAQGVTTAALTGQITRAGEPIASATVTAVHEPSGTVYNALTRENGRYTMSGMRVGGPYTVTARQIGAAPATQRNVFLNLGVATEVSLELRQAAISLEAVTVTAEAGVLSSDRTGAATTVPERALETLPTISREISAFTRLTPQASGTSFAGQDNRLNNITIDGSYFNNSFGLAGQPGQRTGVAPIPLDAVEQIQVAIAPFDVRQGNFVGAGVNAVTKSGTNEFEGSFYYFTRNESFVGDKSGNLSFTPGEFDFDQFGARVGGPILKNKLFFFVNYENDKLTEPATNFLANTGSQPVEGNVTRVLQSDIERLQSFLLDNFDYETGPYTGFPSETPSERLIAKVDYNLSTNNKLSLRYLQLDSESANQISNSSSLGVGNRRDNSNSMSFFNSGYGILENIRSLVGEWNASFGGGAFSNTMIAGYTKNDESRNPRGTMFPLVDVLQGSQNYLSFGFEPFTPNNELRYNTYQFQNNLTWYLTNHELTLGATAQRYESENVFFPGAQSVYVYNSLEDFFTDAQDYLANPNRTTSPVTLNRFQVRYNNIPGQVKPIQPLEVLYTGAYAQDQWRVTDNLRLTAGLRFDIPSFGNTALRNQEVEGLAFLDEDGNETRFRTDKLPDANILWSPRLGFNWDARGDRSTQLRGGTGIFSGSPAFVWISNQVGNNGVLTGFIDERNTTARPFNPNPDTYKPTDVTGAPASSYELAFTDPDFTFPQVWRSNIAVDQRLPWDLVGTVEFLYGKDVNGVYYINSNQAMPTSAFAGPDTRARYIGDTCPTVSGTQQRVNCNITSAVTLKNQNVGYSYNISGALEKTFSNVLFAKAGYNYGVAKNTVDPGSIAFGSFANNAVPGDPNQAPVSFSANSPGHRAFLALSYTLNYFNAGATTISLFTEGRTQGNVSYIYSNDMNGDGFTNDLIYVPADASEMNFQQYTEAGRTYTADEQAAAFEAYIQQDPYLSENRGVIAERNAVFAPMRWITDFSVAQDLYTVIGGRRNKLQVRLDVLNFLNLLNSDWGQGDRFTTTRPLRYAGVNADGEPIFRVNTLRFGGDLPSETFQKTVGVGDVYRLQLGFRYTFGN